MFTTTFPLQVEGAGREMSRELAKLENLQRGFAVKLPLVQAAHLTGELKPCAAFFWVRSSSVRHLSRPLLVPSAAHWCLTPLRP